MQQAGNQPLTRIGAIEQQQFPLTQTVEALEEHLPLAVPRRVQDQRIEQLYAVAEQTEQHGFADTPFALGVEQGQADFGRIGRQHPQAQPRRRFGNGLVAQAQQFIDLLKSMDSCYPPEAIIRLVLDNHSADISRDTMANLATRPGRFEYVHPPKHGFWLNLIECAFSKMARTFLRRIRGASVGDLKARILRRIDEMNATPVVFRWKKFDLELA